MCEWVWVGVREGERERDKEREEEKYFWGLRLQGRSLTWIAFFNQRCSASASKKHPAQQTDEQIISLKRTRLMEPTL